MRIRIQAYGIASDIAGRTFELDVDGDKVGDVRKALFSAYPSMANLASLLIAVNEAYAGDDVSINPGDEVVLIPPVSGG